MEREIFPLAGMDKTTGWWWWRFSVEIENFNKGGNQTLKESKF
jgi:hypothetical protein